MCLNCVLGKPCRSTCGAQDLDAGLMHAPPHFSAGGVHPPTPRNEPFVVLKQLSSSYSSKLESNFALRSVRDPGTCNITWKLGSIPSSAKPQPLPLSELPRQLGFAATA